MHDVHMTYCNPVCSVHCTMCTPCTVRCTLYVAQCTVYVPDDLVCKFLQQLDTRISGLHFTVRHNVHCMMYNIQCTVYVVQSTLCTVHERSAQWYVCLRVYYIHCTMYSVRSILENIHITGHYFHVPLNIVKYHYLATECAKCVVDYIIIKGSHTQIQGTSEITA